MHKVTSLVSVHVVARRWWWRGPSANTSRLARRANFASIITSTAPMHWLSTSTSTERQVTVPGFLLFNVVFRIKLSLKLNTLYIFFIRIMTRGGISPISSAWHQQENLNGTGPSTALKFWPSPHWDSPSSSWRTMFQHHSCTQTGPHTGSYWQIRVEYCWNLWCLLSAIYPCRNVKWVLILLIWAVSCVLGLADFSD